MQMSLAHLVCLALWGNVAGLWLDPKTKLGSSEDELPGAYTTVSFSEEETTDSTSRKLTVTLTDWENKKASIAREMDMPTKTYITLK